MSNYFYNQTKNHRRKLRHALQNCNVIKKDQAGVCRFVKFKNLLKGIKNNKTAFLGVQIIQGLQIENRIYYDDHNTIRFRYMNKKNNKILEKYDSIPEWATPNLIALYEKKLTQFSQKVKSLIEPDSPNDGKD